MKKFKRVVRGGVLLLAVLSFTSCKASPAEDVAAGLKSSPVENPTAVGPEPASPAPDGLPATPVGQTPDPAGDILAPNESIEQEKGGGFLVKMVQLSVLLMIIAMVGWLIYDKFYRVTRRQVAPVQTKNSLKQPKETVVVYPSGTKGVEPSIVEIKTTVATKKVDPVVTTAKVERPVITTSTPSIIAVGEPEIVAPNPVSGSTAKSSVENITPDLVKVEPKSEGQSLAQERATVQPPQIGEPSSFARFNWWDKDKEWCLVSPQGMSSDVVCDIGTAGSLAIAAASLRGHKHKVSSEPCQDAFNLRVTTSKAGRNYLIAVLCDGMSSAKYSDYGARRTSQLLALGIAAAIEDNEIISDQIIESVLPDVFKYCKDNLIPQKRNQYGAPSVLIRDAVESDFNTTVTFLIIPTDTKSEEKVEMVIGSIGDSAVFVLDNSTGSWSESAKLELNSEILNPATSAFPATFEARVSTVSVETSDLVIATSDGVGNFISVRGTQTLLGNYLAKQWAQPVNLPTFINDVGFDLKSADDDRTVIAIWLSRG